MMLAARVWSSFGTLELMLMVSLVPLWFDRSFRFSKQIPADADDARFSAFSSFGTLELMLMMLVAPAVVLTGQHWSFRHNPGFLAC